MVSPVLRQCGIKRLDVGAKVFQFVAIQFSQ
jgi:hypothetical protein